MTSAIYILVLMTLLSLVYFADEAEGGVSTIKVPPNFGCVGGRKADLFRHRDISACHGSWRGHIEDSRICTPGWHLCSGNDTELLNSISWYEASHVDGCYAINAAQNDGRCTRCSDEQDELAGIGADCPRLQQHESSCFGTGKIDASCCSRVYKHQACSQAPWINGVLCCKDQRVGSPPLVTLSPVSSVKTPVGVELFLKCKAKGNPPPRITWYKNGFPMTSDDAAYDVITRKKVIYSKMTIPAVTEKDAGLYLCKAHNTLGYAISYTSDVRVYQPMVDVVACRNRNNQQLLNGGTMAACEGRWKGVVRKAGKQLCARGWHVCGLKDRSILNQLSWKESSTVTGCYAYDAATSDHFACSKCSKRQKGNRMAGIGAGCGMIDRSQTSCLNKGRIHVWGSPDFDTEISVSGKTRRACRYHKGVTTGVMCCKSKGKKREAVCSPGCENGGKCVDGNICICPGGRSGVRCEIKSTGKKCETPCQPNSHCSKRGVCKCDKGFKMSADVCVLRHKGKKGKCPGCLNGGRCRKGRCVCPTAYEGERCERDRSPLVIH